MSGEVDSPMAKRGCAPRSRSSTLSPSRRATIASSDPTNPEPAMARSKGPVTRHTPRTRLEAIPWTRFTVQAQAQLEKEGALRQRRLGALGTVDAVGLTEVETEDEEAEEKPKEKE